jgi:CCR4-NOT transcription complex subunit 4
MSKTEDKTKKLAAKKVTIPASSIPKLSNLRIIQKHLVYVIGLSSGLASKDVKCQFKP